MMSKSVFPSILSIVWFVMLSILSTIAIAKSNCYIDFVVAARDDLNEFDTAFVTSPEYKASACVQIDSSETRLKHSLKSLDVKDKMKAYRCTDPQDAVFTKASSLYIEKIGAASADSSTAFVVLSYPCSNPDPNCRPRACGGRTICASPTCKAC
jgi:hypothetical protein